MQARDSSRVTTAEQRLASVDGIRERLKNLEWHLPIAVQGPLLRTIAPQHNPYTDRDHSTRSIFIHVPKTGGVSVGLAIGGQKRHFPVSRYAAFDADSYNSYFKFAFVRNPWDRLLSAYSYLRSSAHKPFPASLWARKHLMDFVDFEEFVLKLAEPRTRRRIMSFSHFRPQLSWVALPGASLVEVDFVGRFERFEEDFCSVAERLGVEAVLPITNSSEHSSYKDAYTGEMREIAALLYRADIEAFGYDF